MQYDFNGLCQQPTLGLALLGQTNIASTFVLSCASVRAGSYKFGL
jgi:hypothetical protein